MSGISEQKCDWHQTPEYYEDRDECIFNAKAVMEDDKDGEVGQVACTLVKVL